MVGDQVVLDGYQNETDAKTLAGALIHTGEATQEQDFLDMTALIRSIQRIEGNFDCFGKAKGYCDRLDCAWYQYCLGGDHADPEEKK